MALNKNSQILFLAYYYPPIKSPGVKRSYSISHLFQEYFDKITVITTSNRKIMAQEIQPISPKITLLEIPTFDYRFLSYLILKNRESAEAKVKKKKSGKLFLKAMRSFPINLLIGEGAFIYIWRSYRAAKKLIVQNPQTVVYSSFSPYADHLVAYLLKRKFPNILWVADFRDLHVDPTYQIYLWKNLQLWFNKKIIAKATFVTTVSEGLAQNLRQFHDDVFVLPNGVTKIPKKVERYKDKFTISYTGAMFQDKRQPHLLLRAIEELIQEGRILKSKIRIQQAGRDIAIWEPLIELFNLEDVFETHGVVSMDEAHLIQSKSHINLLLTTSHSAYKGVLTSKIFEYFAAANPIAVVINGPKDEIYEQAMSGINHLFIGYDKDDVNEIKQFVLNYYHAWLSEKKYSRIEQREWESRYYWPKMIIGFYTKIKKHIADV